MFDFDESGSANEQSGNSRSSDNQTDRVNGEYHYKNGYTQKIYTDAHYVREDENTIPPRYYTPHEKPVKGPRVPRIYSVSALKLLLLGFFCALIGGVTGAALVGSQVSDRLSGIEAGMASVQDDIASVESAHRAADAAASPNSAPNPAAIYDAACEQVVSIETEVTYSSFFGRQYTSTDSGSGFIITDDGYILTNYHVVEAAFRNNSPVKVSVHSGDEYDAKLTGFDESGDIAVLKIEAEGLTAARIGDSGKLRVGEEIYAVGSPLSWLDYSMTTGNVSALDREVSAGDNSDPISMFQIDAPVNSGNSGGPVYNANGEVVGIVTAKYSETGVEGLGFAIPINDAYVKANSIITKGYVTGRACLSLSLESRYNSVYSQYYGLPLGAYVSSVEAGGCADAAGIKPGDIIVRLGEEEVTGCNELNRAVKRFSAGDSTQIVVYRDGEELELPLKFDEEKPICR